MTDDRLHPLMPMYRYRPAMSWELSAHQLISPRPDGSVAYYQDSLAPTPHPSMSIPFSDGHGRILCNYLSALVAIRNLQPVDGPYLQILEDDGAVPQGWHMIRAVIWIEEYDLVVPTDADASAGPEPAAPTDLHERRTPDQWCAHYGIEIRDPDGWRGQNDPSWDTPIDLLEFCHRAGVSTTRDVGLRGYDRVRADLTRLDRTA